MFCASHSGSKWVCQDLDLEVEFTKGYPVDEVPSILSLTATRGRLPQMDQLVAHLNEIARESLGMASIFSIVTGAEDWLREHCQASNKTADGASAASKDKKESITGQQEEMIAVSLAGL